jgi:hypothetical protein
LLVIANQFGERKFDGIRAGDKSWFYVAHVKLDVCQVTKGIVTWAEQHIISARPMLTFFPAKQFLLLNTL